MLCNLYNKCKERKECMAKYIPLKSLSFEEEVAARVKQYSALGAYKHLSVPELS